MVFANEKRRLCASLLQKNKQILLQRIMRGLRLQIPSLRVPKNL